MLDLSPYNLSSIEEKVFYYFSEISNIPRGSGNMEKIADYCEKFSKNLNLKYIRDDADNVVIFKDGANGGENAEPIILQGHLDIVCQATEDTEIDFLKDGLQLLREGDFIKAKGTTLGADNGIAIAYIMAILASSDIKHPPIEAVFTTDEEIGLLGAGALDCSALKAKRMLNLDSETEDILTVSCAGGQDVTLRLPIKKALTRGHKITVNIKGLLGGHSGAAINKGRTNANILLGEILYRLQEKYDFNIISLKGGTKTNAIPQSAGVELCIQNAKEILNLIKNIETEYCNTIKPIEPDFYIEAKLGDVSEYKAFDNETTANIINLLNELPNGVIKMSEEISGLVETSLNLGILTTEDAKVSLHFALRSNKEASLHGLTDEVLNLGKNYNCESETAGFYPPWEYNPQSPLRELYKTCFNKVFNKEINIEAIHAGLECGVFANKIKGLDCISVGPNLFDVHTPNERLDILSAVKTFNLILKVLAEIVNFN
ncbi:MAG: aminoacyl-histidine dipeptidase [Clostridia bacterium]|nr:aminoacyl-histidine dipeptidase [Clostridia bacterium]